jgi:transcriptional regulator with XRE-family HTH domain
VETTELQQRFGAAIRRCRLEAGLGQEKLADEAGIHRTHVSLIERGQGMPTLLVIHKLAAALGTTMAALMAEVESDAPPASDPPAIPRGRPPRQEEEGPEDKEEEGGPTGHG